MVQGALLRGASNPYPGRNVLASSTVLQTYIHSGRTTLRSSEMLLPSAAALVGCALTVCYLVGL